MADIQEHDPATPGQGDNGIDNGGINLDSARPAKRQRAPEDDDDDDDKGGRERRKIDIKFINDKSRR